VDGKFNEGDNDELVVSSYIEMVDVCPLISWFENCQIFDYVQKDDFEFKYDLSKNLHTTVSFLSKPN